MRFALARGCTATVEGFIEQTSENFAMLRAPRLNFLPVPEDVFVPRVVLQLYKLRPAQRIAGTVRLPRDRERSLALDDVTTIEGLPPEEWNEPTAFDDLTPQYPQGRILLENTKTDSISARAIDLLTPLGHGQRGLIVAAPRVGKTILLKEIAKAIRMNHPDIELIVLLGGRTSGRSDRSATAKWMRRFTISTFDESAAATCAGGGTGAGARETAGRDAQGRRDPAR